MTAPAAPAAPTLPPVPLLHVLHVPGADPARDAIVAELSAQARTCVHADPERNGLLPNWLGALDCAARTDLDNPWALIVSDDADPLNGWTHHLPRALQASPAPLLGLTHFGGYGRRPVARGAAYGTGRYLLWGGAIGYHRSTLGPLHRFGSRVWAETGYPHDDVLACAWAFLHGHPTAFCARAVFDQPVTASLLGHHSAVRRPRTTIANTPLPPTGWATVPRSVPVARAIPLAELQRWARYARD